MRNHTVKTLAYLMRPDLLGSDCKSLSLREAQRIYGKDKVSPNYAGSGEDIPSSGSKVRSD
jgi:hypothetical protein